MKGSLPARSAHTGHTAARPAKVAVEVVGFRSNLIARVAAVSVLLQTPAKIGTSGGQAVGKQSVSWCGLLLHLYADQQKTVSLSVFFVNLKLQEKVWLSRPEDASKTPGNKMKANESARREK